MNPTFCKYILQRREGQFSGFIFLILALNCEKSSGIKAISVLVQENKNLSKAIDVIVERSQLGVMKLKKNFKNLNPFFLLPKSK